MIRPDLNKLSKPTLVGMYRTIIGSPGDYARRNREFYRDMLEARGTAELIAALEINKPAPRKTPQSVIDKRNALANAKEFQAIAKALVTWGRDLIHNPAALAKLQERAKVALGS